MVVVELQYSGRASPSTMEEEEVLEREREAPKAKVKGHPFPPLYIGGPRGGAGQGVGGLPPKQGGAPPFRVSPP